MFPCTHALRLVFVSAKFNSYSELWAPGSVSDRGGEMDISTTVRFGLNGKVKPNFRSPDLVSKIKQIHIFFLIWKLILSRFYNASFPFIPCMVACHNEIKLHEWAQRLGFL